MSCQLAALTNTYHGYSLEDALAGTAAAGFENVELAAVRGWTNMSCWIPTKRRSTE
jgi:L-ribulose-5-phosphate 3-epimerase